MRMSFVPLSALVLLAGITIPSRSMQGKDVNPENQPRDRITVVGHFSLTAGPINRLLPTQHYSRYYLYAEGTDGKVSVIDVTDARSPARVENVYPQDQQASTLLAVAGTAALVGSPFNAFAGDPPQTVRIMNFSDPGHPRISREFTGVTAVGRDNGRGLVFLANGEGIWILREHFALDPAIVQEYTQQVLYDR